ncbi:alcohol dehydrogenase catalytic domain-containing protein [Streptomyces sp. bgisy022]|uniref:alcohol dehydrogenase catalytic domain-containing protein n=1 Tax=Streptomyces sp. bgisy022 TaxID=3413769 RepID=UPI003D718E95
MRAWQFNEVNEPFTLVECEDPKPGADEIVIDVKASGLCHSDVSFVDGTLTPILGYRPIILGHETAGVVSAVGADVSGFAVGDRVGIPAVTEGPGPRSTAGSPTRWSSRPTSSCAYPTRSTSPRRPRRWTPRARPTAPS